MPVRSISLFTFLGLIIFSIVACQSEKSEREKMYTEVMEIHDRVMPEMGTIHRLKKQLKAIDTTGVGASTYPAILTHLGILENADEAMMSWMAEFSNPTTDTKEAIALEYLKNEREKISAVRDQMLNSINATKSLLSKIKTSSPSDSITIK